MTRTVWQAHEADVIIYRENASGVVVNADGTSVGSGLSPTPITEYCYMRTFKVSGKLELQRRAVTGRAVKKITRRAYEYEASVGWMAFKLADELKQTTLFNRSAFLRFVVFLRNPNYIPGSGTDSDTNDTCVLKSVAAESFNLNGSDVEIVMADATFQAEGYAQNPADWRS